MIRDIYVVVEFHEVKGVCECKEDADTLASICGDTAEVVTKPYFPAYGYMKLTTRGVENE